MLKHYLKIAVRNLLRERGYSWINIVGLAVGMACFILIVLWVRDELSYDKFHLSADRLYRVTDYEKYADGNEMSFSVNPPELAPTLIREFPEIVDAARYRPMGGMIIRHNGKSFSEDGLTFTDASFFSMFSFPFIKGEPTQVLSFPNSVVITQRAATKYFGDEYPIGKILQVDDRVDLTVTGIIEDVPSNSHLQFDLAAHFSTVKEFGLEIEGWNQFAHKTYVLLAENADSDELSLKIAGTIQRHDEESIVELSLQPVTDIHLSGDESGIYIFSIIAAFVLLTACINYMNLATARSGKRSREVALRKVVGASRKEIVFQFLGESILTSFTALSFALLLVEMLLPFFNQLSAKQLSFSLLGNSSMIFVLLSTAVITGTISGSYPALFVSSLVPAEALKGSWQSGSKGALFRRVLVSMQFVLSIALIIGMVVISRQLHYIRNQKLGFDKEQVLCISLKGEAPRKFELLKSELSKTGGVAAISAVSSPPTRLPMSTLVSEWEGQQAEGEVLVYLLRTDCDFARTLEIQMTEGRFLSEEFVSDESEGIVVNQAAVRSMGLESPLGKQVLGARIVGEVKDFHFSSLHSRIKPLAISYRPDEFRYLLIKMNAGDISDAIGSLESRWKELVPGTPFDYQFLDERINMLYRTDQRMGKIINSFTVLALFIACLGLFGMASFTAQQRTKEIGIRKVLGATVPEITFSLIREFGKWVLLANVIAWPLAYFTMNRMLEVYAYRIRLDAWIFLAAGAAALILAVATVSYQSIKAALANPVETLRYE
ncbi:MAG: ABC transporter permease [Candidatus Zixiibacteriota bacterium]|nr:MAG: ABC transporter permease [candidate division Zixibacteria bacterium]